MEVALIPPFCQLHRLPGRKFQMLLPEALSDRLYSYQYKDLTDSHVILDNGMFEEEQLSNERLIELAVEYGANEIVMPDVRGNPIQTLALMEKFLNVFTSLTRISMGISLMAVIQVSDPEEIPLFIAQAVFLENMYFGSSGMFSYGIPRRLAEDLGSWMRVAIVRYIESATPGSAIHLLGVSRVPTFRNEIEVLRHRVRSIDTSAPFVWAAVNANMETDPVPHQRPTNYLKLDPHRLNGKLVQENIDTLDAWTHGS